MEFGAIFDWDGVIIDSSAQHERSWELLADEIGKALPEGHFKRGFGKKNERIIPELGWATEAAEIHRLGLRKEELYRELVRRDGVSPLRGARELLMMLREAGIPCAVGSSTHRENIETICEITGLRSFFAVMVTAEDVSHGKPDPEVFLKGAEKLGVAPGRCIVFEDALVGLEAARAGGMKSVGVATTEGIEVLEGRADLAVESLAFLTMADLEGLLG